MVDVLELWLRSYRFSEGSLGFGLPPLSALWLVLRQGEG